MVAQKNHNFTTNKNNYKYTFQFFFLVGEANVVSKKQSLFYLKKRKPRLWFWGSLLLEPRFSCARVFGHCFVFNKTFFITQICALNKTVFVKETKNKNVITKKKQDHEQYIVSFFNSYLTFTPKKETFKDPFFFAKKLLKILDSYIIKPSCFNIITSMHFNLVVLCINNVTSYSRNESILTT